MLVLVMLDPWALISDMLVLEVLIPVIFIPKMLLSEVLGQKYWWGQKQY